MPRRLTRAESQARTRERVLESAAKVFRESGYHGSSLEEVAARAGFSRGAVYSNFANKEELFLAVYDREVDRRTSKLLEVLEQGADSVSGIQAAAEVYSDILGGDPAWSALVVEFLAHASRDVSLRAELRKRSLRMRSRIAAAFEEVGERLGVVWPVGPEQLALAAITINAGTSMQRLLHRDREADAVFRLIPAVFARAVEVLPAEDPVFVAIRPEVRGR